MHSGTSLRVELTAVETANASISEAGYGARSLARSLGSRVEASTQRSSSSGRRMTGIRSWTRATRALASVVRIEQVRRTTSVSEERHSSQMPANANGAPSPKTNRNGYRALPSLRHS